LQAIVSKVATHICFSFIS